MKSLRGIGRRSETELGGTETERKGANRGAGLCFFLMVVFSHLSSYNYLSIMVFTCFYHFSYQLNIVVLTQICTFQGCMDCRFVDPFFLNSLCPGQRIVGFVLLNIFEYCGTGNRSSEILV